jgi:hypothetical protein
VKRSLGVACVFGALLVSATSAAAQTSLAVDPVKQCYREQETVSLLGSGFTANGFVDFSRAGSPLGDPVLVDPSGALSVGLVLPGLTSGQRTLTYDARDETDPSLTASASLLVTATDVSIKPAGGRPDRRLRISARGYMDGDALFAHVKRLATGGVRTQRIGAVEGPCGKVSARTRLFGSGASPGRYRIQFDTYRHYAKRAVQTTFAVRLAPQPKPKPKPQPKPSPPPTDCQGYSPCLPPGPDVDCAGGSGDGPRYVQGPVYVTGSDPYDLDRDGDGVGCQS